MKLFPLLKSQSLICCFIFLDFYYFQSNKKNKNRIFCLNKGNKNRIFIQIKEIKIEFFVQIKEINNKLFVQIKEVKVEYLLFKKDYQVVDSVKFLT